MTPYECYLHYIALKNHFNTSYDIIKYNGKVKRNIQDFEKRNDKPFFAKLAKKPHCKDFLLANIINNSELWIGDLSRPESEQIYKDWLLRQQSLTYIIKSDIKKMDEDFDLNFQVRDGQYPQLLGLYISEEITIETIAILVSFTKCIGYWSKHIVDPILFPRLKRIIVKYEPLIHYDRNEMRRVILNHFDNTLDNHNI